MGIITGRKIALWSLGGLSLSELFRRTAHETWQDGVFGHGGRMAFYQFLAVFPSLFLLITLLARIPHAGNSVDRFLQDFSQQVLPSQASHLLATLSEELRQRASSPSNLVFVVAGALWAACNATWAMIYGLNCAYEVKERRPWWRLALTIGGLTLSLALTIGIALFLLFGGTVLTRQFPIGAAAFHIAEWFALILALSLFFALLYRFAPNLRDHKWRWSTPGAVFAILLWVAATSAARVYFERINDYSRTYGHLNGVVMLLLWLYVTNGAILIGGEMNSEIEKAADHAYDPEDRSG